MRTATLSADLRATGSPLSCAWRGGPDRRHRAPPGGRRSPPKDAAPRRGPGRRARGPLVWRVDVELADRLDPIAQRFELCRAASERPTSESDGKAAQVEWSFVLGADLFQRRQPVAGDEGIAVLRAARCAWSIGPRYIVRCAGEGLTLTVLWETAAGLSRSDVGITTTLLHRGGKRTYFECPGLPDEPGCGARVAKLYLPLGGGHWFACRRCHRLAYASTQQRRRTIAELRARVRGAPWATVESRRASSSH